MSQKILKLAASLRLKKYRDRENLFVAEGVRSVETAVYAAAAIKFCVVAYGGDDRPAQQRKERAATAIAAKNIPVYEVSAETFAKISATKTPQGIMAAVEKKVAPPGAFADAKLLAVTDNVRDPGNLGAILRSADAFAADGAVTLKNSADVFADKTVRASMGAIFHVPVAVDVSPSAFAKFAVAHNFRVFVPLLDKQAKKCFAADLTRKAAFVFGNEAFGATRELLDALREEGADCEKIYIPMPGSAESLNVANAAAVLLYERQRQLGECRASVIPSRP